MIFCPISFEHYIETAGKDFEHFKKNNDFLNSISSGYCIKPEVFIMAELVSLRVRQKSSTYETFFQKDNSELVNLENIYQKLHQTKSGYNEMITEDLTGINSIRNIQGTLRLNNDMKEHFINTTHSRHKIKTTLTTEFSIEKHYRPCMKIGQLITAPKKVAIQCFADTFVVNQTLGSPHQHLW